MQGLEEEKQQLSKKVTRGCADRAGKEVAGAGGAPEWPEDAQWETCRSSDTSAVLEGQEQSWRSHTAA